MQEDRTQPSDAEGREDPAREGMRKAVQDAVELAGRLAATKVTEESVWFRNLMLGILKSALRDYRFVEIGVQKQPYLAAWGARNLLELRVVTTYVLRSEDDALAFKDDFVADLKEFWEAMTKSSEIVHKRLVAEMRAMAEIQPEPLKSVLLDKATEMEKSGPDLRGPLEEVETYRNLMNEFGIDPKRRPMRAGKIAASVNQSEMFDPRFKVNSKLVHPTALSIASTIMPNSLDPLLPLMSCEAGGDFLAILSAIKGHIDTYGMAPKP
jgi:hypothetical protein